MERHLSVDIVMSDNENATIEIFENESSSGITLNTKRYSDHELIREIGLEVLSWLELMRDEYKDYMIEGGF